MKTCCQIRGGKPLLLVLALLYSSWCFSGENGYGQSRPTISPDGQRIAFACGNGERNSISLYDFGSGHLKQLTKPGKGLLDFDPSFFPDGTKIVYARTVGPGSQLYIMNADGSNNRSLGENKYRNEGPVFSPDGKRIYFARAKTYRHNSTFGFRWDDWDIYSIKADGSDERKITTSSYYLLCCLSYSSREDSVFFAAIGASSYPATTSIYVVKADGSMPPVVVWTEDGIANPHPVLSPDGTQIAFVSQGILPEYQGEFQIFLMNSGGHQVQQITRNRLHNSYPVFSPDAKKLFFLSRSEYRNKFILSKVNIDGSGVTSITIF